MTSSIHDSQDLDAPGASSGEPEAGGRHWLITAVRVFTATMALGGVAFLSLAFSHDEWKQGVVGMTLVILACTGGAVLAIDTLLADRNTFFQRGKLTGFWEGIHGVPPSSDDPLLRR